MKWTHDDLAADLAGHLKAPATMVWTDMQLGPSGSPRPDVYLMHKSYVKPNPVAYECKISRSDFLSDVTSGKWISYLKYAFSVVFATPAGLISAKEVPETCGLIMRHEKAWRYAKRPVINPIKLPQKALIKLLIDGIHREGSRSAWSHYADTRAFEKKFGATAARYVADAANITDQLEHAKDEENRILDRARKQAERIQKDALYEMPGKWRDLLTVLELPEDTDIRKIRSAINKLRNLKELLNGDAESSCIRDIARCIERYKYEYLNRD